MATKFSRTVDAIAAVYAQQTGDATVPFRRGQKLLSAAEEETRIVFVRDGGGVEAPTRLGPIEVDGELARPARSRLEHVMIHIFAGGKTDDEADTRAEQILDALIVALDTVLATAIVGNVTYAWISETEAGASWAGYGAKVVLELEWRQGVVLDKYKFVVPETFGVTASIGAGAFSSAFSAAFSFAGGEAA